MREVSYIQVLLYRGVDPIENEEHVPQRVRLGGVLLTPSEEHTLRNRIRRYLDQCRERRETEDAAREKRMAVCRDCNGTGEVRRKVWSDRAKRYVYATGKMPCSCQGLEATS